MRRSVAGLSGETLHSAFSCVEGDGGWSITLEARGGTKGTSSARNPDYARALQALLSRLAIRRFILIDAVVDSATVRRAELPDTMRRLSTGLGEYPVELTPVTDVRALASGLKRSQASIGQVSGARGGNTTRRMRLQVVVGDLTSVPDDLEGYLALGDAETPDADGWWKRDPEERYWLEITGRSDIGRNLNAPAMDKNGDAHWSYALIRQVRPGDVVFHYDTRVAAIVGVSRVAGEPWKDDVVWAARGRRSRLARIKPHRQPGWYVGLEAYTPLDTPIDRRMIEARREQLFSVREELRRSYGDPVRYPFVPYGASGVRAFQGYLVKFPRKLLQTFPELGGLRSDAGSSTLDGPAPSSGAQSPGAAYRDANEDLSVARRDPFQVDPALVERGLRGHAQTQNSLAAFVRELGAEPRSPVGPDPNFDLLWELPDRLFVAEVKSLTPANEEKQLRLWLGQVLRYSHLLTARTGKTVVPVLVVERQPRDGSWIELCRTLGVRLVWPEALSSLRVDQVPQSAG